MEGHRLWKITHTASWSDGFDKSLPKIWKQQHSLVGPLFTALPHWRLMVVCRLPDHLTNVRHLC